MANIQANINQMISLAGLLASQSPALRAGAERRALQRDLERKEEARAVEREVLSKTVPPTQERSELLTNVQSELADIKKQQFELDPSAESYESYYKTKKGADLLKKVTDPNYKTPSEIRTELADKHRSEAQAAKMETRRRILEGTPSEYLMRGGM